MATVNPAKGSQGPLAATRKITGWYAIAAVLFLMLGMLAIIEPAVAAVAVSRLVGLSLIFGGLAHLIGACMGHRVKELIFQLTVRIDALDDCHGEADFCAHGAKAHQTGREVVKIRERKVGISALRHR